MSTTLQDPSLSFVQAFNLRDCQGETYIIVSDLNDMSLLAHVYSDWIRNKTELRQGPVLPLSE